MFLWVLAHSRVQSNADANAMAKMRLRNSYLGPKPAITISLCDGSLKIKEWMTKKLDCYTEYES
jgi:hypothetical protein